MGWKVMARQEVRVASRASSPPTNGSFRVVRVFRGDMIEPAPPALRASSFAKATDDRPLSRGNFCGRGFVPFVCFVVQF
jgi:hypothetical protein